MQGLGFRILDLGLRVRGLGFRVWGLGYGFGNEVLGFWGIRVYGIGVVPRV
jgi:hypothetical protein